MADSDHVRQAAETEAAQLRERLEAAKQERSAEEQEFLEELQRKYDRDMATLEEEYRSTKHLYESVSKQLQNWIDIIFFYFF